jgi:isovaleryl-CoA dehydrogenase
MNLPGLNFDLGPDLDMLRDAVRQLAQEPGQSGSDLGQCDPLPMDD